MATNEAFPRVKIDAPIKDERWDVFDTSAILFDAARGAIAQASIDNKEPGALGLPHPPIELRSCFVGPCLAELSLVAYQASAAKTALQAICARAFPGDQKLVVSAEEVVTT